MIELFILIIVVLGSVACTTGPAASGQFNQADSCRVHVSCPQEAAHIDLFVYSDAGTRPLLQHCRSSDSRTGIKIPRQKEDVLLVAIANLPGEPDEKVLGLFDNMEHITMPYSRENPDYPIMSGIFSLAEGDDRAELDLTPLLCRIEVESISSALDYPLEEPVLYLSSINAEAGILRMDGFHPSHTVDSPENVEHPEMMLKELPFGLGRNEMFLDCSLFCYPNDDSGHSTQLGICGKLYGEILDFRADIGKVARGERLRYKLELSTESLLLEALP